MKTIAELISQFQNPGDDGLPDDFADQIQAAHEHEVSVREAKITEIETANQNYAQTVASLKSHNYDLIRAIPANQPGQGTENTDGDGKPKSFDDLFTTE